jgi:hypothetical protein
MTAEACVFAGPSLGRAPSSEAVFYPPAQLGSVWQAVERGHRRIGLIDGVFGARPAVWHKEILYALSRGCTVVGGASMGALRAAELCPMGMLGRGAIWRLYRRGALIDDAEVALLHADDFADHPELTVPLVDLRFTLRLLRRRQELTIVEEAQAARALSSVHFTKRDWDAIDVALRQAGLLDDLAISIRKHRVRRKEMDARLVLDALDNPSVSSPRPSWSFPETTFWLHQFEDNRDDIPPLPPPVGGY